MRKRLALIFKVDNFKNYLSNEGAVVSGLIYPKREWIAAGASFDGQARALLAMVDRLQAQLAEIALPRPARLSLVGIGASHAAAASAVYRFREDGVDAARFLPSELVMQTFGPEHLWGYISQSGRSAEIVGLAAGGQADASFAVTNYTPSPLGEACPRQLNLGDLPDSSVSFVSFTGTLLALGMLADYWAGREGAQGWKTLITEATDAVMAADADLKRVARMLAACPGVDFVAPAPSISVAEEAALMVREGPRLAATGMETRQYLHGPMDMAGPFAHVVFGGAREALLIDQLAERTQNLVFVTGSDGVTPTQKTQLTLRLPVKLADGLGFALAATMVAQRLTLHAADLVGIDINAAAFRRLDTKTDHIAGKAR